MLPEKLSNGLCSLNPDVDRLVDGVRLRGQRQGRARCVPVLSGGHALACAPDVRRGLGGAVDAWEPRGASPGRRAAAPAGPATRCTRRSPRRRDSRGAIDFETTETYIVCDPNGRIEKIVPRVRNDAHKLIEECMLAANVCAADFLDAQQARGAVSRARRADTRAPRQCARDAEDAGSAPRRRRRSAAGRLRAAAEEDPAAT